MKTVLKFMLAVVLLQSIRKLFARPATDLQSILPDLTDFVRKRVHIPLGMRQGNPVHHAMVSEDPALQNTGKGEAKLSFRGHEYRAKLIETENSDGDFYHVDLTDLTSRQVLRSPDILAFGDVWLGLLQGNPAGVAKIPLSDSIKASSDPWLLKKEY